MGFWHQHPAHMQSGTVWITCLLTASAKGFQRAYPHVGLLTPRYHRRRACKLRVASTVWKMSTNRVRKQTLVHMQVCVCVCKTLSGELPRTASPLLCQVYSLRALYLVLRVTCNSPTAYVHAVHLSLGDGQHSFHTGAPVVVCVCAAFACLDRVQHGNSAALVLG